MSKKQILILISIFCVSILLRLPYLLGQDIAFDYDHGRDGLAVASLVKLYQLKFIGPWTSIPGLFFGPLYYYLLAPIALISNGHPLSQAWMMFLLVLIQVYLAFRYFGFWESVIMATAPAWITLSIGSSNAFPMTLVSWLLLIVLKPIIKFKKVSNKQMFWLGVILSLGFHFSSALAIFLIPAILIILIKNKVKLNTKKILLATLGFLLVFLPQLLFEVKNNFIEAKGVIEYLKYGEKHKLSLNKLRYMIEVVGHELKLASLPEIGQMYLGEILVGLGLIWMGIKRIKFKYWFELLIILVVPVIGFSGLHYNPWYVYGLFPVVVLLVAQVVKNSPKIIKGLFFLCLLVSSILGLVRFYGQSQENYQKGRVFYKNKMKAVDYIYQQAQDKHFSVYIYTPEIYDYAYQYLFFWQGFRGYKLPVEFSYKPGEISYVKEKPELLSKFPQTKEQPEKVFLILNLPENEFHYPLDNWLEELKLKQTIMETEVSEELEVWEVTR
jgi:hypothetical protein